MKHKNESKHKKSHKKDQPSTKHSAPENPRERGTSDEKVEDDMILRR